MFNPVVVETEDEDTCSFCDGTGMMAVIFENQLLDAPCMFCDEEPPEPTCKDWISIH